jgi:hypothetical protein
VAESSIHHYLRDKHLELGRAIGMRRKIYLDLRYWIMVRDTAAGIRTGASSRKLLHFLRRGVANGTLICPIGTSVFSELMKQRYSEGRRIGTARLVDELSLGVTMVSSPTVTGTEIHSWMLEQAGQTDLYKMQEIIWTRMAYVLGEIHPSLPDVAPSIELIIRRGFIEKMWTQSLTDIVQVIGDAWPPKSELNSATEQINAANAAHVHALRSFEHAYRQETLGVADVAASVAANVLAELRERHDLVSKQHDWHVQTGALRNRLVAYLGTKAGIRSLRTLHIQRSLHASARWNKTRQFKPNDMYDFDHASVAVGYCDAFLTEGPLHAMVTSPQLALTDTYDCRVIADLDEAVEFLRTVSRNPPPTIRTSHEVN